MLVVGIQLMKQKTGSKGCILFGCRLASCVVFTVNCMHTWKILKFEKAKGKAYFMEFFNLSSSAVLDKPYKLV